MGLSSEVASPAGDLRVLLMRLKSVYTISSMNGSAYNFPDRISAVKRAVWTYEISSAGVRHAKIEMKSIKLVFVSDCSIVQDPAS